MSNSVPALPRADDLQATWKYIENGVDKILVEDLTSGISTVMYMNVYTAIHNFCVAHHAVDTSSTARVNIAARGAQLLGKDLYNYLEKYLENHLSALCAKAQQLNGETLIQYYISCWDRYTIGARYLNHIFDYLNRYWVKREREEGKTDIHDVYTLCLISWKAKMFDNIEKNLVAAVLNEIERQRNGESVEFQSIRLVVQSFVALGLDETNLKKTNLLVYQTHFEVAFIEETAKYYQRESSDFLSKYSVVDYISRADDRLKQEADRIEMYLHPSSEKKLMTCLEQTLIGEHAEILQNEFAALLKDDRQDDFHKTYLLLSRIPNGLKPVQKIFQDYVNQQGQDAVNKLAGELGDGKVDHKVYVDTLLKVNIKYSEIAATAFESNPEMVKSLDNGCREYINNNVIARPPGTSARDSKTPEYLAKYSDVLLRKSSKGNDEMDIETGLDGILRIFQYIDEKDVFQKHYSRMLARRLVHGSSVSQESEESMVTKLKEACGYEYTNKLQRMFQDMATSAEMQTEFKNLPEKEPIDFSAYILAEGFWPFPAPKTNFNLPTVLKPAFEKFHSFYQSKHSGRKLTWLWNFGKGELKASFSKSSKTGFFFNCSAYEMGILLPYNDADSYTYQQLSDITGLDDETLTGCLSILTKARVLLQDPPSSEHTGAHPPDTTFSLNFDFKSKRVRVNLNLPLKSEQKQETEDTQKKIEEDRKLFLQAVIVRVMKARKELSHTQLIQEAIEQSRKRFNPRVPEIKKTIDDLIEREYLQRIDGNKYQYLA